MKTQFYIPQNLPKVFTNKIESEDCHQNSEEIKKLSCFFCCLILHLLVFLLIFTIKEDETSIPLSEQIKFMGN